MVYLLLDVGGTEIKAGIADGAGNPVGGIKHYSAYSDQSGDIIMDNLAGIIRELMLSAQGEAVAVVAMAFPGPFDYEKGISLMQDVGKYQGIYGVSIASEIRKRIGEMDDVPFLFVHDVEAFAVGAYYKGACMGQGRTMFVCIGTGAGSAFMEDGKVLKNSKFPDDGKVPRDGRGPEDTFHRVPENGWIYNVPYRESVIDDYLSVRGLEAITKEVLGETLTGLELYQECRKGNEKAELVFERFGEDVAGCLEGFLEDFMPDSVVFGGQISKSFPFFGKRFEKLCRERGIRIFLESDSSFRTMQGLYMVAQRRDTRC